MRRKNLVYLLILLIFLLISQIFPQFEKTFTPSQSLVPSKTTQKNVQGIQDKQSVKVVKVVDGDTITVLIGTKKEKVRIIGINTPETVDPRRAVQCFGKEASGYAKKTLNGQMVLLESDPSQTDRDKYGRLLRYIWIKDGSVDFGKMMIAEGFAYEYTYDIPYRYQKYYKAAQKQAEKMKKGLWAENACASKTITK